LIPAREQSALSAEKLALAALPMIDLQDRCARQAFFGL
jgi:hypothetical protein